MNFLPMRERDPGTMRHSATRRRFLKKTAAVGAGLAMLGAVPPDALAADHAVSGPCHESVRDIVDTALTAELLAVTFYYAGLTTHSIAGDAGPHDARKLSFLRATLDQEHQHAQIWRGRGASSPHRHFYFPTSSFERLGFTNQPGTYLWTLDHLETTFAGIYLAALRRFSALGHQDLAMLAVRVLGVECRHRALYRVISQDDPADNITLEVDEFPCVHDGAQVLAPFLTGHGFPYGTTHMVHLPTSQQVARAIA